MLTCFWCENCTAECSGDRTCCAMQLSSTSKEAPFSVTQDFYLLEAERFLSFSNFPSSNPQQVPHYRRTCHVSHRKNVYAHTLRTCVNLNRECKVSTFSWRNLADVTRLQLLIPISITDHVQK